jgi:predicted DNA-binding transcriptional regulator AlpA
MPTKRDTIPDALRHFDSLPSSARVRLPVVEGLLGCSRATIWRMVADHRLPAPEKLSPKVTAWRVGALRTFLNGR